LLVSIMHVNNEIGSIQNIKEIGNIIKKKNHSTYFHVDGVQAFGKVPVSVKDSNIDLYSISAHKIHGPKGVGALYVKKGTRLQSLFLGGGQEKGYRSGTENVPGISGLGKAVEIYYEHQQEYIEHLIALKRDLAERITENIEQTAINGPSVEDGAPHILNISFAGIRGEVLLHALEQKGVLVSTGSACSSRKKKISHVLEAIGLHSDQAEGAIRFSLSPLNTKRDIEIAAEEVQKCVQQLRKFRRK